jgi:hypothetical protein
MCDFNNFDVILGNTFWGAYEVDILHNRGKLKVHAKSRSKLLNLNINYNSTLAKMGVNLAALTNELKSPSFLILMFLRVS